MEVSTPARRSAPRHAAPRHAAPRRAATDRVSPLLLLAVATAGIQIHGVFSFDLGISDLFLGAYLLTRIRRLRLPPPIVFGCCVGLVATCAIATTRALAVGGNRAIWGSTRMLGMLIVLAYFVAIADAARSPEARRSLVQAFALGVLAFNLLFVIPGLGSALLGPFPTGGSGRLAGGMFDENSNGTLLAAITLLALTTRPFGRVGSAAAAAVGAGLLLLTFSRTAYAAFLAGLLAYLVLGAFARRRHFVWTLSVVIVATLIGVAAGAPHVVEKHFSGRPDTISTRESFFHLSLNYFKANPLFGAGFGAARQQIGFVIHSTFFALLGEAGVLAAACIVLLIGTVLFRGLRLLRRPTTPNDMLGLLCTNACMIVASFGIDGLLHRHWWIVLGLLLGATYGATTPTEQRRPRHAATREPVGVGAGIGTG